MSLVIRPEEPNDYDSITLLLTSAFAQDAEAKLVNKLRKRLDYKPELALVAEQENMVAGFILFTPVIIRNVAGVEHQSLALAPVAVLPKFQQIGIGSALIVHGLEKAVQMGYSSVIVLGHAHYYPKFGFKKASCWNIQSPFPVPDEVFMAKELTEGGLMGVEGLVIYSPEFLEL